MGGLRTLASSALLSLGEGGFSVDKPNIDRDKIHRPNETQPPSNDSHIRQVDDVVIQVTQAFCPKGHNLVRNKDILYYGEMGISLWVSDGEKEGEVVLSPFHGEHNRKGMIDFADGTKLQISCPVCRAPLPRISKCSCETGELYGIYMTEDCSEGNMVALCNVWGCHRSKVYDQAELLSAYMEE